MNSSDCTYTCSVACLLGLLIVFLTVHIICICEHRTCNTMLHWPQTLLPTHGKQPTVHQCVRCAGCANRWIEMSKQANKQTSIEEQTTEEDRNKEIERKREKSVYIRVCIFNVTSNGRECERVENMIQKKLLICRCAYSTQPDASSFEAYF